MKTALLFLLSLGVAAAVLTADVGAEEPATLPARGIDGAGPGYVGTNECRRCHEPQFAKWRHSSHAHTFERVSDANLPADVVAGESATHAPGRSDYSKTGETFRVTTQGDSGKDEEFHLSHVVGRMRVRMFIATMGDGRLQVLPAMLEEPTGEWFDYTHLLFGGDGTDWDTPPVVVPGDGSFWTGSVRAWDAKCARCHNSGRRQLVPKPGEQGTRSTQRAQGVDCEMCHGPGAAHVDHHDAGGGAAADPVLRYAALARDRQVSVCLRCHMESEVVDADFQVGDDIFEHVTPTLMISPDRIDPYGRVVELIYDGVPFSASRCAQEGGLTCTSCHDPHGSGERSQLRRAPEDNSMCTQCHEAIGADPRAHSGHDPEGSGGNCVACHMPFLAIERGHGVVADHSISIPRLELPGDRVAQDACTWCHTGGLWSPGDAPSMDPARLADAYAGWWPDAAPPAAWQQALTAARTETPGAHVALSHSARDGALHPVIRASATRLLSGYAKEAPLALLVLARDEDSLVRRSALDALGESGLEGEAIRAALLDGLTDPSPGVRIAAARAAFAGYTRITNDEALRDAAIPVLREDVAAAPAMEDRWFRLGAALQIAGDYKGALAAYERYVALEPTATAVKKQIELLRARVK